MSNENGVNGCIRLKIVVGPIYSTVALLVFGVLMAATVPEGSPSTVRWRTSTTVHSVEEALEAQREASDNIIHTLSGVGTLSVDPNAPNPALGPFASKWGFSGNSYPIVFVHGMIGWGGEKLLGHLYYWGGLTGSLPQLLVNHGYQVFQPALSCSSNWERACELYAQIKGTRVDYGVAHAKKYGHARFGKDFTGAGLDPAWGSPGHKVHFIGHSMGGPTTQLLISLLQMGSKEEVQAAAAAAVPVSPLFLTNKSASQFVSGFFSISGVLQGTPAKEIIDDWSGFVIHFIQHLTMIKDLGSIGKLWDFQLGHWGLEQKSDESILSYVKRIFKSDWANGTSNAAFDLSITGSRDPARAPSFAQPGVYYFSVPTSTTDKKPNGEYVPRLLTTLPFLIPTASAIGRINDPKLLGSDSASWRDNDGLVPVKSSSSDAAGFIDFAVDLRSSPLKLPLAKPITGKYHNTGIIEMDHGGVVGMTDLLAMMHCSSLFLNMARILLSLPR